MKEKENEDTTSFYIITIMFKYYSVVFSNVEKLEVARIEKWFFGEERNYRIEYSKGFTLLDRNNIEYIDIKGMDT